MSNGKFASSGIVVGHTPRSKRDQRTDQLKGNKVTMGKNVPGQTEGAVGDITVREVTSIGLRCYIKTNSGWFDVNSLIATFRINWIDMNLINSWATDATYGTPQYCKDQNGFVHLRGGVDTGAIGNPMTTLPKGFRPNTEQRRMVTRTADPGSLFVQVIRITTAGEVKRLSGFEMDNSPSGYGSSGARGANADGDLFNDNVLVDATQEVCFDGISFFAHQKVTSIGAGSTVTQEQFPSGFPVL